MALDLGELVAFLDLDTSKFDKAADRMPGAISGKAAAFGAAGLVIGGVMAAALAKGLSDAISFDDSLATISGSLALTEAESARVGAAAGRVYAQNYGESVEQVQGVIGGIITQIEGMGEASDSVVDGMTAKVLNYADAFGFETSEAIAMVQQLMTTGLASSADEAMDLMVGSMQKVPEALRGDMADAITEYAPFLASLGVTGNEAFGMLVAAADKGMYGIDKTGDALKEFTIRATDMSKTSGAAFETLGLDQEEMANRLLAGGETARGAMADIVHGLYGIENPAKQAEAAIALFGTPLEDLGVNEIPNFLRAIDPMGEAFESTAGAAEAMGEKMGSSTASQMESMNRQIQIMMSDLMAGLLPVLSTVFGFLAENPAVVQGLAIALGVLAAAFLAVAAAMWVASLTPIALIIGAIVLGIGLLIAAIVLLVQNWDAVWSWITSTFEGIVAKFQVGGEQIISWWNGLWSVIAAWATDVWNGIASWFAATWQGMIDGFRRGGDQIASWWTGLWSAVGAFFTSVWQGIVAWAMSTVSGFIAGWRSIWSGLTGFFSGLWSGITSGIRSAWNGAMDFLRGIPGAVKGFFSGIGEWLIGAGKDLIGGFIDGIKSMIGDVGDAIGGVMDFVGGFFPHSPAKRGPFSGSGWTAILSAGEAISEQFAKGLHGTDPFAALDRRMGELVGSHTLDATLNAKGSSSGGVDGARVGSTVTVIYNAAENRSLSAEEDLFAALGSPRVTLGKGD